MHFVIIWEAENTTGVDPGHTQVHIVLFTITILIYSSCESTGWMVWLKRVHVGVGALAFTLEVSTTN